MILLATASGGEPVQSANDLQAGKQFEMPQWVYVGLPASALARRTDEAKRMRISALAAGLAADTRHPGGASDAEIAAMESSLGARLPNDFRELHQGADGVPALDIGPLSKMAAVSDSMLGNLRKLDIIVIEDDLDGISGHGVTSTRPNRRSMKQFAVVGTADDYCFQGLTRGPEGKVTWLVDLNDPPLVPAHVLLRHEKCKGRSWESHGSLVALDLHSMLAEAWAKRKADQDQPRLRREAEARARKATVTARAALAREDIPALVERIKDTVPAGVLVSAYPPFHGPATPAILAAAEARLGMRLPADYRAFLSLQNGLESFGLWPAAQLAHRNEDFTREAQAPDFVVPYAANTAQRHLRVTKEDLRACVGVGLQIGEDGLGGDLLLWCPNLASRGVTFLDHAGIVGSTDTASPKEWLTHQSNWLTGNAAYADFTEWLRDRIALEIHHQYLPATGHGAGSDSSTTQRDPSAFDRDLRIRGVGPKFSERDNRHVIALLWALLRQTGPMTVKQLLADPELHLQREPDSAGDNSADGTELIGSGPVSRVRVDTTGESINFDMDSDRTCIAANAVMAQTGTKPGRHFYPMIDGGGGGSGPEFQYDAPDGTHFMKLSQGCSEFVEIYRYKGMHMPKRPGT
jgi:cell wall assembly regulator SMI1